MAICFRVFKSADLVFTLKPFKIFRVDDDIAGMRAAGKLAATRAMTVLEDVFRALKLVADGPAQAATPGGSTHNFYLRFAAV